MSRLTLRRNPVSLIFSPGPWAAAWYLLGSMVAGTILFAVIVTSAAATVMLSFTLIGMPLLLGLAAVIQGCAAAERSRLRVVGMTPPRVRYRETPEKGMFRKIAVRWSDPATWGAVAYLTGCYGPMMVVDYAVFGVWLLLLAGITAPAWYTHAQGVCLGYCPGPGVKGGILFGSFPHGPHGPHGPGAGGVFVDTLPKAFLMAAVCLVAFVAFSYVLVAVARLQATIARVLLGAHDDPLREAKEVLRRPGPLSETHYP